MKTGKSVSNAFMKGSFTVKSGNSVQVVIFSRKTFETKLFLRDDLVHKFWSVEGTRIVDRDATKF